MLWESVKLLAWIDGKLLLGMRWEINTNGGVRHVGVRDAILLKLRRSQAVAGMIMRCFVVWGRCGHGGRRLWSGSQASEKVRAAGARSSCGRQLVVWILTDRANSRRRGQIKTLQGITLSPGPERRTWDTETCRLKARRIIVVERHCDGTASVHTF